MTIILFDSTDLSQIPANPQAVAAYVGGSWPNYSRAVALFPKALHLSVAVSATEDADCLDVENGDATPADVAAWIKRQQARGLLHPAIYASLSTMPAIRSAVATAGIEVATVRLWVAEWTGTAHIPDGGYLACQWTDAALGRNLDQSECLPAFFDEPSPPVTNLPHYDWFINGSFPYGSGHLNEMRVVERYDRARKHPIINKLYLGRLRKQLVFLAGRVACEALHYRLANGKPSWGKFHRGYRYQQLIHRAQGQRFV